MASRRCQGGFTLMEVIVAIAIFALIGVASYRVLSSVTDADGRLELGAGQLRAFNRTIWLLQQDLEQLAQRPIRDAGGLSQPALRVDNGAELPLQLTRAGRANPLELPRSNLQRVAWRLDLHPEVENPDSEFFEDETLYLQRLIWPMLDGAGDPANATVQVLLPGLESLEVRVRGERSGIQPVWPQTGDGQQDRPLAVQLRYVHPRWGAVEQWFKVP
jgi:general secretion pathway protein J